MGKIEAAWGSRVTAEKLEPALKKQAQIDALQNALEILNKIISQINKRQRPVSVYSPPAPEVVKSINLLLKKFGYKFSSQNGIPGPAIKDLQILGGVVAKAHNGLDVRGEVIGVKTLILLKMIAEGLLKKKSIKEIKKKIAGKYTFPLHPEKIKSEALISKLLSIDVYLKSNQVRYLQSSDKKILWRVWVVAGLLDPNQEMNDQDLIRANRIIQAKYGIDNDGSLFGPASKRAALDYLKSLL